MFIVKTYEKRENNSNAILAITDKRLVKRMNEFKMNNCKNINNSMTITLYRE